ncbi:hypothetical protein B0H19DRAFT_1055750 [Mycena capillaripes]|nr:hypothetical protein B0H19DRAFT_1055750 [Mycena capillaripes]
MPALQVAAQLVDQNNYLDKSAETHVAKCALISRASSRRVLFYRVHVRQFTAHELRNTFLPQYILVLNANPPGSPGSPAEHIWRSFSGITHFEVFGDWKLKFSDTLYKLEPNLSPNSCPNLTSTCEIEAQVEAQVGTPSVIQNDLSRFFCLKSAIEATRITKRWHLGPRPALAEVGAPSWGTSWMSGRGDLVPQLVPQLDLKLGLELRLQILYMKHPNTVHSESWSILNFIGPDLRRNLETADIEAAFPADFLEGNIRLRALYVLAHPGQMVSLLRNIHLASRLEFIRVVVLHQAPSSPPSSRPSTPMPQNLYPLPTWSTLDTCSNASATRDRATCIHRVPSQWISDTLQPKIGTYSDSVPSVSPGES